MNQMFRDSSLAKASLETRLKLDRYLKLLISCAFRTSLRERIRLYDRLRRWPLFKKKVGKNSRHLEATIIQKHAKGFLARVHYSKLQRERFYSALIIQRVWRRYHREVLIPQREKQNREQSAILIQRFLRGWRSFNLIDIELKKIRIIENLSCFTTMKYILEESAQIKIRYHWFKFKVNNSIFKKYSLEKNSWCTNKYQEKISRHYNCSSFQGP